MRGRRLNWTPGLRLIGAAVGAAFGLMMIGAGVVFAGSPTARDTTVGIGAVTLALGAVLGWIFGPSAARDGLRSAASTAALVTAAAVPLGAVGVAVAMVLGATGIPTGDAIAGTLGIALAGLIFLGIPLAGLVFVAASVWVGLVRLALRTLDARPDQRE